MTRTALFLILPLLACNRGGTPETDSGQSGTDSGTSDTEDTDTEDTDTEDTDTEDTDTEDTDTTPTAAEWIALEASTLVFYPFDGNADDAAASTFDGTVDGATLTTDRNGTADSAYAFDGVDDTIVFGDIPLEAGSVTFSYWIKADASQPTDKFYRHLSKREICNVGNFFDFQFIHREDGSGAAGHELRSGALGSGSWGASASDIDRSAWTHIALTVDADGGQSIVYVNGAVSDTQDWDSQNGALTLANDADFGIATSPCIASDDTLLPFKGEIDDIAIFSRALAASEIAILAQ